MRGAHSAPGSIRSSQNLPEPCVEAVDVVRHYRLGGSYQQEVGEIGPLGVEPADRHATEDASPGQRFDDRLGGARQPNREFIEEAAIDQLDAGNGGEPLGDLYRRRVVEVRE